MNPQTQATDWTDGSKDKVNWIKQLLQQLKLCWFNSRCESVTCLQTKLEQMFTPDTTHVFSFWKEVKHIQSNTRPASCQQHVKLYVHHRQQLYTNVTDVLWAGSEDELSHSNVTLFLHNIKFGSGFFNTFNSKVLRLLSSAGHVVDEKSHHLKWQSRCRWCWRITTLPLHVFAIKRCWKI